MKFYQHANGMIYFLQGDKVKFMPPGMRWTEAFDAEMSKDLFPLAIAMGELKEIK